MEETYAFTATKLPMLMWPVCTCQEQKKCGMRFPSNRYRVGNKVDLSKRFDIYKISSASYTLCLIKSEKLYTCQPANSNAPSVAEFSMNA